MLPEFINREDEIFDIVTRLKNNGIDFVLIGGYAVSAFKHRFSIDADIVVKESQLDNITAILNKDHFIPYKSMDLENIYQGKFRAFIKKVKLPITVDLLINAVSSRQTDASWSFELFKDNSIEMEITGIEKSMTVRVPARELIIATKIHSCRLTDIRDIVAICDGVNIGQVIKFAKVGNLDKLKVCIKRFKETVNNKNFVDSFKGVFAIEKFPSGSVDFSKKMIEELEKAIS